MDVFLGEWVNLLLRWAHMVVAIGWIGTSFYFVALDYSLSREGCGKPGLFGDAWQVHGGGFYHVEKYRSRAAASAAAICTGFSGRRISPGSPASG